MSVCFLDPRRHVGDCLQPGASWQSSANWLMATAYPAVVPALLSGIYLGCGSKNDKLCAIPNLQTRLAERLGGCGSLALLLGALPDWLLDTEVIKCLLSGPAQARGGLPTARSQLAKFRQLSHGHGLPRSCACATERYLF
ncbi:hypothetical protein CSV68_16360 [Sporosarcina sp. P29]|nr:hypothetical protein CSV68_16360 [Sporosarcina sp. P29]